MTYNNIKETAKHRIVKVTMDVKYFGDSERGTPFWRLHALKGDTFVLFESKNPISSWRTVKDSGLADEFESFKVEYAEFLDKKTADEPEWTVDWIIQVVPDQLHPKYERIVDIRESGNV